MLISRLLRRQPVTRNFAQLDTQGNCVSLWVLENTPDSGCWVQVSEFNPLWLGQPLPKHASVSSGHTPSVLQPPLSNPQALAPAALSTSA